MSDIFEKIYGTNKDDLFELLKNDYFENLDPGNHRYEKIYDGLKITNIKNDYYVIFNSFINEQTLNVVSCIIFPIKDKLFSMTSLTGLTKEEFNNDTFLHEAEKLFTSFNTLSSGECAKKIYHSTLLESIYGDYIIREVK